MKIILRSKYQTRPIKQSTNKLIAKGGEKKMKNSRIQLVFGLTVFILATLALMTSSWAVENVRQTKHNLSASGNPNVAFQETTEVCIFCHTPHGGRTDVGKGAAPLWNRSNSAATSYNMYTSPNYNNVGNLAAPQGVSLACLSCHDGTIAFDSLINTPGSGTNLANGRAGWNCNINGVVDSSTGGFNNASAPYPNLGEVVGPGAVVLTNDHPISMQIPCNTDDKQFDLVCGNLTLTANTNNVQHIARNTAWLPSDTRDRLRAYPNPNGGTGLFIECASCHNPHEASRPGNIGSTATDTNNSRFLRLPSWDTTDAYYVAVDIAAKAAGNTIGILGDRNAGSLLCLSCHQK